MNFGHLKFPPRRVVVAVFLLGAGFCPLTAQWSVRSQSQALALGGGSMQIKKELAGPVEVDLNLVIFDAARYELRVVGQTSRDSAVSLTTRMKGTGAVAGCNGGYFTPDFQPLGLEISEGRRAGTFQRSSLLGGLLMVRKGRPVLLWRDEFVEQSGMTDLVQAGPRLVNGGLPVKGLESTKRRPRTFVLTDTAGRWALGTCRSVSLRELSDILATRGVISELEVERALNLDGGSSTGLWWRDAAGQDHTEREFSRVRNFLAIFPKAASASRRP